MTSLLTGPGLALLIVVPLFLAAAGRKAVHLLRGSTAGAARGAGATATEELHGLMYPGKRAQLEQRRIELVLRDDEQDGAPRRTGIDLDAGTAHLSPRDRPH
ncbi:DUF6191 domain-containing protein [Streptomyces sp. URMC 126]|uniref:DUF6191 domain-containing protein n=1 Tax=Streptomyces sp. URMC 126 TaxID=3423401 RepID=UPI003F1B3A8B